MRLRKSNLSPEHPPQISQISHEISAMSGPWRSELGYCAPRSEVGGLKLG